MDERHTVRASLWNPTKLSQSINWRESEFGPNKAMVMRISRNTEQMMLFVRKKCSNESVKRKYYCKSSWRSRIHWAFNEFNQWNWISVCKHCRAHKLSKQIKSDQHAWKQFRLSCNSMHIKVASVIASSVFNWMQQHLKKQVINACFLVIAIVITRLKCDHFLPTLRS